MKPSLYTVIDFECTCWDKSPSPTSEEMEVIEIGAVVTTRRGDIVDEFQSFVRPSMYPELTEFCKTLTTITQEQVNTSQKFPIVYRQFTPWLCNVRDRYLGGGVKTYKEFQDNLVFPEDIAMVSWGRFDLTQLGRECRRMYVPVPFKDHINLKMHFRNMYNVPRKQSGLGHALAKVGIEFEGTPHRGIDDARHIARMLQYMLSDGFTVV